MDDSLQNAHTSSNGTGVAVTSELPREDSRIDVHEEVQRDGNHNRLDDNDAMNNNNNYNGIQSVPRQRPTTLPPRDFYLHHPQQHHQQQPRSFYRDYNPNYSSSPPLFNDEIAATIGSLMREEDVVRMMVTSNTTVQKPKRTRRQRCCRIVLWSCCLGCCLSCLAILVFVIAVVVFAVQCNIRPEVSKSSIRFNMEQATNIYTFKIVGEGSIKLVSGSGTDVIVDLTTRARKKIVPSVTFGRSSSDPSVLLLDVRLDDSSSPCRTLEKIIYLPDSKYYRNMQLIATTSLANFDTDSNLIQFQSIYIHAEIGSINVVNMETTSAGFKASTSTGNISIKNVVSGSTIHLKTSTGTIDFDNLTARDNISIITEIGNINEGPYTGVVLTRGALTSKTNSGSQTLVVAGAQSVGIESFSGATYTTMRQFQGSFNIATKSGKNTVENYSSKPLHTTISSSTWIAGYIDKETSTTKLQVSSASGSNTIIFKE